MLAPKQEVLGQDIDAARAALHQALQDKLHLEGAQSREREALVADLASFQRLRSTMDDALIDSIQQSRARCASLFFVSTVHCPSVPRVLFSLFPLLLLPSLPRVSISCLFVCSFVCFIASQHTLNQLRLQ